MRYVSIDIKTLKYLYRSLIWVKGGVRMKIIEVLMVNKEGCSVKDIVATIISKGHNLKSEDVSRRLREFRKYKIVQVSPHGREKIYRLSEEYVYKCYALVSVIKEELSTSVIKDYEYKREAGSNPEINR